MGQRVNATAIRLFNKEITQINNLWFDNNKINYSQYVHDDIIIHDYIKHSFENKNFKVLNISIKRLNNKLFINICLFIPNQKLKNLVSELKTSYYYEDIIKLRSYDYDNQFYPIKLYNSHKNYNYNFHHLLTVLVQDHY